MPPEPSAVAALVLDCRQLIVGKNTGTPGKTMTEFEFMQVAVGRYADTCIPPSNLQVDCPFVVDTGSGYSCETQCRTVQRQLLRVSPERVGRSSFDAGMLLQLSRAQSEAPNSQWHPSALFTILRRVMTSYPFLVNGHLQRTIDGTQAVGELAHLGLDMHLLLGVYAEEYSLGMDAAVSLQLGPRETAEKSGYISGWTALRDDDCISTDADGEELNPEFRRSVAHWLRSGDAESIVDRRPPDQLPRPGTTNAASAEELEYRWLATRLTETYLDNWSREALEMEFRYIACMWRPSAVPGPLIGLRTETRAAVADALAAKVLSGEGDSATIRAQHAFTEQAVSLVELGDNVGAARLLEVGFELYPGDWMIANNYGFCLIPSDPARAANVLAAAMRNSPIESGIPLVEANTAVALIRAGDIVGAARLIDSREVEEFPEDEEALLWVPQGLRWRDAALEAKWVSLREYWALLKQSLTPEELSSDL
jgi:hypothetical protein